MNIQRFILLIGFLFFEIFIIAGCRKNEDLYQETEEIPKIPLQIGVFGASMSVYPESETAKKIWKDSLDITVKSLGVGGATYSMLISNNVPSQIEKTTESFDIYILWSPSNDVIYNIPVGEVDSDDPTTHNGGLLKSIELIKQKNKDALILLFTSIPRFDKEDYYNKMQSLVNGQIAVCERNRIPCLDQWKRCGFDKNNFTQYYLSDKIHLTNAGYKHIGTMQMEFIRENIEKYIKKN
jgi:hypothetical protein